MQLQGELREAGLEEMIEAWEAKFGLDQPLWRQYLHYMADLAHLDLGYSLSYFPRKVTDMIGEALPWTIGLMGIGTLVAFTIGTLLGALLAWPKTPKIVGILALPFVVVSAVPYYLLGLVLVYLLGVKAGLFPIFGGHTVGVIPSRSFSWYLDIAYHSVLPLLSLVIAGLGRRILSMRGLMVTILGEDYMVNAEAKGLKDKAIFYHYGIRNALLPQVTNLALQLGFIVSGSVILEKIFAYPGIGSLLADAISKFDYNTIYGIVFLVVLGISLATFMLDLIYPLLDPRVKYEGR
jgi:peptide/nickel transport system permease protein